MFQNNWIDNITAHEAVHGRKSLSLRFGYMIVDLGIHRAVTSQAIHNRLHGVYAGAVGHSRNVSSITVQTLVHAGMAAGLRSACQDFR